jgi:hypothetical protein
MEVELIVISVLEETVVIGTTVEEDDGVEITAELLGCTWLGTT